MHDVTRAVCTHVASKKPTEHTGERMAVRVSLSVEKLGLVDVSTQSSRARRRWCPETALSHYRLGSDRSCGWQSGAASRGGRA